MAVSYLSDSALLQGLQEGTAAVNNMMQRAQEIAWEKQKQQAEIQAAQQRQAQELQNQMALYAYKTQVDAEQAYKLAHDPEVWRKQRYDQLEDQTRVGLTNQYTQVMAQLNNAQKNPEYYTPESVADLSKYATNIQGSLMRVGDNRPDVTKPYDTSYLQGYAVGPAPELQASPAVLREQKLRQDKLRGEIGLTAARTNEANARAATERARRNAIISSPQDGAIGDMVANYHVLGNYQANITTPGKDGKPGMDPDPMRTGYYKNYQAFIRSASGGIPAVRSALKTPQAQMLWDSLMNDAKDANGNLDVAKFGSALNRIQTNAGKQLQGGEPNYFDEINGVLNGGASRAVAAKGGGGASSVVDTYPTDNGQ